MSSYGVVYFVDKYSPSPSYPFNSWDTASDSIADILNIADEYSIIKIAPGEYIEDITLENISGITIIGSGSGAWNGNSYHGGTIIKGAFRWNDSAKNIKITNNLSKKQVLMCKFPVFQPFEAFLILIAIKEIQMVIFHLYQKPAVVC